MDVQGKHVVVTGKVAGESRISAEQKLREHGAQVASSITKTTELLVTGEAVGAKKIEKAAALGVAVVPWESLDFVAGNGAAPAAPVERLTQTRQIAPMLCHRPEPGDPLPSGPGWSFELKWDGYRCVATIEGGKVSMRSRSDKTDLGGRFPHVAAELAGFPDCVLDGEVVVLDAAGDSSFAALVGASNAGGGTSRFVVFDVLERDGADLRDQPLSERRIDLDALIIDHAVTYVGGSPVFDDGEELYTFAAQRGLEGIVAKRNDSRYVEGGRGPEWSKHKVRLGQEFVVAGYMPGEGNRKGLLGALILAVNVEGGFVYCGKVGTGFDRRELERLTKVLDGIRTDEGPAASGVPKKYHKDAVWVEPSIVVQVSFQRWTEDGCLWHPVYEGQRIDKDAIEVVRET